MKVSQILTDKGREVHTVSAETSMREAVDLLGSRNIGAVVVTDSKGAVTGILSERDVVRATAKDSLGFLQKPVSSCMTARVVTCSCDHTVDDLMNLMTQKRIRHVPVVEGGKLTGLISIGDVVKRKLDASEQEAAAMRDYIATG